MPILFLIGIVLYYIVRGAWFILKLPFKLLYWIVAGIFMLLAGIFAFLGTVFGGVRDASETFLDALWSGDGSVIAAKLLTIAAAIGTIVYLLVKHA